MKKILIALCVFLILAPCSKVFASALTITTPSDTDRHWAEKEMASLNSMGVLNGYDGYLNPDNNITRGEFAALLSRAFGMGIGQNTQRFTDIDKGHVFYYEIMASAQSGIINGFPDGTFRAEKTITREEIVLMVSRLSDKSAGSKAKFSDIKDSYKYLKELSKLTEDGIIGGFPDGTFRPQSNATRAQAASIITNAMKKYLEKAETKPLRNLAREFTRAYFNNSDDVQKLAVGSALADCEIIKNTYRIAKKEGYTLKNDVSGIDFVKFSQEGPFTSFTLEYDVSNKINDKEKTYTGRSEIKIISRNGENKVFEHTTSIIFPEFINMTWEVFQSAPKKTTPGVNVVSPTSFRIESEKKDVYTKIETETGKLYFNNVLTDEYVDYARKNNYNIWAMYKTDFTLKTSRSFLKSMHARQTSAELLAKNILKHRLDGINFDFENIYKADKGLYTSHVKEVSVMAHCLGAVVSADVTRYEPTSSNWSLCYNRDALSKYCDYIMLMAYDQHYSGGSKAGAVAEFEWAEKAIKKTLEEVPAKKLVLGIPFYTRQWQLKDGKVTGSKALSMAEAQEIIKEKKLTGIYDKKAGMQKFEWSDDESRYAFWLENAATARERVKLAKKYSLSGVASWRRGFETEDVWLAIGDEIKAG